MNRDDRVSDRAEADGGSKKEASAHRGPGAGGTEPRGGAGSVPTEAARHAPERRHAADRLRAEVRLPSADSAPADEPAGVDGGPDSVRPDASPEWRELFRAVRRSVERLRE